MKKLIPALALLLVSAVMLATSSFAWFSMNTTVTVTGMSVTTKVGSNLAIAETNSEASFVSGLHQVRTGILEPVSTTDGVAFFWHSASANVTGSGTQTDNTFVSYSEDTAISDEDAGKTNYDDGFVANYGFENPISSSNVAYGYIDYSFYLKATNSKSTVQQLGLSKCNLTYKGGAVTDKAWRVAVFATETTAGTTVDDEDLAVTAKRVCILKTAAAAYNNGTAAKTTATKAAVETEKGLGVNALIDSSIPANTTKYYKIIVRLWLEGEDTSCNNSTYAPLTGDYRLDLALNLNDTVTGVSALGSGVAAVATADTLTGTVTLSDTTTGTIENGELAASFQWYTALGAEVDGATTYQYTAPSAGSFYCIVTTARGSQYRTNNVDLAPAP